MKITFNVIGCGLENNGGSLTIIESANTLVDLGHEVVIIDDSPNRYTWGPLRAGHRIIKDNADIPTAAVIISTGYRTVRKMLHFHKRCGKQFWWIRGWETWNYPEQYITNVLLKYPVTKMVNGIQLQEKLSKLGVESHLVRPGYDLDAFNCLNLRDNNPELITLGGLYSNGKKRNSKRTDWILKAAKKLKKHHNVQLWMFGADDMPNTKETEVVDRYFKEPSTPMKNEIYNWCDIWLAPTELEGLHMPPAEAMLTECPVVGTNAELSGMSDYLVDGVTGLVAENNYESFLTKVQSLVVQKEYRVEIGKAGGVEILRLGDRKTNMQKMVEVLT